MPAEVPPRLLPAEPLPPYSYVSGMFPHPLGDPQGHSFGLQPAQSAPLNTDHPRASREYLRGIDLFNHGYYWEAHETWEGLWHQSGRHGEAADFFKCLIKLAAAGVKAREGRTAGVRRHANRAVELLERLIAEGLATFMDLDLAHLIAVARALAAHPEQIIDTTQAPVRRVMPFNLKLKPGIGPPC